MTRNGLNPRGTPPPRAGQPSRKQVVDAAKAGSDPFAVGAVWRGSSRVGPTDGVKTTQQIVLTITERNDNEFKGRLTYNGTTHVQIEGSVSGETAEWQIRVRGQLGLPHKAKVNGNHMDVEYEGPGSNSKVEGVMSLNHVVGRR